MDKVLDLFQCWAGEPCLNCSPISANGSNRQYYRLTGQNHSCMAAVNPDLRENRAFCYYSRVFFEKGLRVPELYAVSASEDCYLQQDLGDDTLYQLLQTKKSLGTPFDDEVVSLYRQVLSDLAHIQVAGKDADFSYSYPRPDFDWQSIQWDLNYFKYYFLKTSGVAFDEQLLEDDFQQLIHHLTDADCSFFLYRDFQSRNVMLYQGKPYYIDYQGGRRGAAQYDVASLLYSAKSELPEKLRDSLLDYYVSQLQGLVACDPIAFKDKYYSYVLVRILQAMGAYGFRGLFERKEYFLQSIPLAKKNLKHLLDTHPQDYIPYLSEVLNKLCDTL
ncbi:MAG: phosphotransferase [Bacteroidales bacterium]|nr:phosphotransferase [Bacteroidales bacterium]